MYGVTPLGGGRTKRVHCSRLISYRDSLHGSTVPRAILDLAERTESRYEDVENLIDGGEAPDGLFFRSNERACQTTRLHMSARQ